MHEERRADELPIVSLVKIHRLWMIVNIGELSHDKSNFVDYGWDICP